MSKPSLLLSLDCIFDFSKQVTTQIYDFTVAQGWEKESAQIEARQWPANPYYFISEMMPFSWNQWDILLRELNWPEKLRLVITPEQKALVQTLRTKYHVEFYFDGFLQSHIFRPLIAQQLDCPEKMVIDMPLQRPSLKNPLQYHTVAVANPRMIHIFSDFYRLPEEVFVCAVPDDVRVTTRTIIPSKIRVINRLDLELL